MLVDAGWDDDDSWAMANDDDRSRRPAQTLPDFTDELIAVLWDAGADEAELTAAPLPTVRRRAGGFHRLAIPDRIIDDGARVDVPGWDIDAVWTPGHTPGQLCFHAPEHRLLRSGDHVLASISPHISISRSDRAGDPLGDFLDSLQKVARLDADEVLPAHRHRFGDLAQRVDEITRHHHDHLEAIESILADGPLSLWQVAARLKWNRPWEQFPLGLRRSAVNETAAHRAISRVAIEWCGCRVCVPSPSNSWQRCSPRHDRVGRARLVGTISEGCVDRDGDGVRNNSIRGEPWAVPAHTEPAGAPERHHQPDGARGS